MSIPNFVARRTTIAGGDAALVEGICTRISARAEELLDRGLALEVQEITRSDQRVSAQESVGLSFRLCVQEGRASREGCVLMPFVEAATLAGSYLMLSEEALERQRELDQPDELTKDALRDLGQILAGAVDKELATFTFGRQTVVAGPPQGVRAGVRPAFAFEEGEELVIGRIEASIEGFSSFELILMLPTPDGWGDA